MDRLEVRKTYKLFIGGAFPRSESGRTYEVAGNDFVANACLASRKDARDAVVAARSAFSGWSAATAYNRSQVIYRVAEMVEASRTDLIRELSNTSVRSQSELDEEVTTAVDLLVWYAGWCDKIASVFGSANPVAGPYFNFSIPEPSGVIAVVASEDLPLLGLVSVIAPALVSGNTVVALSAHDHPQVAISFAELIATSDVPAGVVNILTGQADEIMPWLAEHSDVNGIDIGAISDANLSVALAKKAAVNVKRVYDKPVSATTPGTSRLRAWLETKTVWHPIGS